MTTKPKTLEYALLATGLAVLLLAFILFISHSGGAQYRADAFVLMRPFTNAVLEPVFEHRIIQSTPGVFRLYFQRSFGEIRNVRGQPPITNSSVVIQVAAVGKTGETAQKAANEAAVSLCATIPQLYSGTTAEVLNEAHDARRYSGLRERLKPRFGLRSDTDYTSPSSAIVFTGSGVSIDPGTSWKQHYSGEMPAGTCQPTLLGEGKFAGTFILVHLLKPEPSDFKSAMATVRKAFDTNPNAAKDSFKEEEITTDSGLRVSHASFSQANVARGMVNNSMVNNFIVTNAQGRYVVIMYLTPAASESDAVHQMICKTLRLK